MSMGMKVLTVFCAPGDAELLATTLRDLLHAPVHQRHETVLGLDFDDARTGERVAGALDRIAIEVDLPGDRLAEAVEALAAARRRRPIRWRMLDRIDGGRIE